VSALPRFSTALTILYALVLVAVALDAGTGFGFGHRLFVNAVIVALTLEAGHIILTYFLFLGDPVLRARFPWLAFLALNVLVFAGLWTWRSKLRTDYALCFLAFYDAARLFHNTQQGYGVARLLAADAGAPAGEGFRRFTLGIQLSGYLGIFSHAFLPDPRLRRLVGLATLALPLVLYAALWVWSRRPGRSRNAALWLGRYCFLSFGSFSEIAPSFVRAIHGLEYQYVFLRFFRGRAGRFLLAAIAAAVALQVAFTVHQMQKLGFLAGRPWLPLAPLLNTLFLTHMVQDWWIFAHDEPSRRRFREVVLARPAPAAKAL
jgi:hypothetical protein